ncbi:uncharacterized protein FIBRA_04238 [Fibroporia radiculosa]|uniref:Protein-S-isoprenylcysteine O-methyltransferase n=1 Tax=Fibroporia radiculosa TaxID=599839 RepID=J4GP00_9APHY|nr:uncharacterized protein FIBRA_04238 [Fibroporia radiculosa]CCM02160.1 predicted protein [Fibroporia radiculosa]
MALAKIPLLLLNSVATYIALTPPNPKVPAEERAKNVSFTEHIFSAIIRSWTLLLKVSTCGWSILEVVVIFARNWRALPLSQHVLNTLVNGPHALADEIKISTMFLVGCSLVTGGALIRALCYRTLGRHFTYEVAILKNHSLVTRGPYAYVRHPSYTAASLYALGVTMCSVCRGSWAGECGVLDIITGQILGVFDISLLVLGVYAIVVMRMPQEDMLLREQFGAQWETWARKVPYKLIPYVY